MYFFVRYTGYVLILSGVFLMLAGLAGTIYGFVEHEALLVRINESLQTMRSQWRVEEMRFLIALAGLAVFVLGMVVAALGQLLLIFADLANHTRETNILLRSFRSRRRVVSRLPKASAYENDEPVG